MTTQFDTAIPDLIEVCEGWRDFHEITRACAVRDLRGRVRLVVEGPASLDLTSLATDLRRRLRKWFEGPILHSTADRLPERRLARSILERATGWPAGWPQHRTNAAGDSVEIGARWCGYQRVLSKQAWLDERADGGAWALNADNPAIIAFYSFKGGVGRSTLLGVLAWQLANAGKKVVCLDLDLEAPGLAGLFDVNAHESVIDHLLTHAATGQLPPDDPVSWVTIHQQTIGVVPAGRVDRSYIEKLARLDYLGTTSAAGSPVAQALKKLLERIKGQHTPDFILLDCRAGIHDLGGLSLTDVAHVDVLVGRDTPQGREGLGLTLEMLGRRRCADAQRILIAQTMIPLPTDSELAGTSRDRFRRAMYEACQQALYAALDDEPGEDDNNVAHYPWPIGLYNEIAACEHLGDVSTSLLENPAFSQLRSRLEALAAAEET